MSKETVMTDYAYLWDVHCAEEDEAWERTKRSVTCIECANCHEVAMLDGKDADICFVNECEVGKGDTPVTMDCEELEL